MISAFVIYKNEPISFPFVASGYSIPNKLFVATAMSTEKFYVIKGIKEGHGPSGEIPLRREVDEWYEDPKNKDQVNLFFLALQEFQSIPVTERDSYYQIAGKYSNLCFVPFVYGVSGIHGQPLVPWDENDQQSHKGQFGGAGGYCAHRTVLFPTWHRPYVLLFEVCLPSTA